MWRLLFILAMLFALAFPAGALGQDADEEDEISLLADFGFTGKMPTGRNAPVRVWVQPGADHISGTIELEYVSGQGLTGRIVSPIEAAAGTNVSVPMVVPMPEWCERITLTLRTQGGGRLAQTVYEALPGSTSIQLRPGLKSSEELLLSLTPRVQASLIGQRFVAESIQMNVPGVDEDEINSRMGLGQQVLSDEQREFGVMSRVVGVNAINPDLPITPAAYEGVLAVVVDETSLQDTEPRAIMAIQQWVLGGGRLVVLVDQPGNGWRRFLPPGVPTDVIEVGALQDIETPSVIGEIAESLTSLRLNARPMSLGLLGEEIGWRQRWQGESGALIVEGPAGLGWVTLVSAHPDSFGVAEFPWKLWADVLSPVMQTVATNLNDARTLHNAPNWNYQRNLGRAMPGRVFDTIGSATAIGSAAILLVAVVTISLAVALGPVDFFLLKALRLRQFAWLSALVWIAIASGFAVIAPSKLRAGPSTASRLVVVDAIVTNEALESAHAGQRAIASVPAELRATKLGMTHFFAGSSDEFTVDAGGVWFEYSASMHDTMLARPTTMRQSPVPGGIESVRGSTPVRIRPGIWSVKTYIDQGLSTSELTVGLEQVERGWSLKVGGLDEHARIESGQLRVGGIVSRLGSRYRVKAIGDPAEIVFEHDLVRAEPEQDWGDPYEVDPERRYLQPWMTRRGVDDLMPSALTALPGVFEHDHAIEAYLATGRFAVVYLYVVDQEPDIGFGSDEIETTRRSVYRLVVPIETGTDPKEADGD